MRQRVGGILIALAILVVPVSVIVTHLLYRFGSETADGVLLAVTQRRAEVRFTTATGDEMVTSRPFHRIPGRAGDHVLVRYVRANPWMFNTIDGEPDLSFLTPALVLAVGLGAYGAVLLFARRPGW